MKSTVSATALNIDALQTASAAIVDSAQTITSVLSSGATSDIHLDKLQALSRDLRAVSIKNRDMAERIRDEAQRQRAQFLNVASKTGS